MNTGHVGPCLVLDKGTEDSVSKSVVISVRITPHLRAELERVANGGPYRMSFSAIVERGCMLAIRELDELAKRLK